jgi:type VI secretion system secreted protein VgrG
MPATEFQYTQTRPHIDLPDVGQQLVITHLKVTERLSALFEIEVVCCPANPETFNPAPMRPKSMLGRAALVTLMGSAPGDPNQDTVLRHFHGLIDTFATVPAEESGSPHTYRVRLVPRLSLLNLATSSRIFEDVTAVDVVINLLVGVWQQQHYDNLLHSDYHPRRICCQYQETDLNFVQRLLEEEGIYYTFEHTEDNHRLQLIDRAAVAAGQSPQLDLQLYEELKNWRGEHHLIADRVHARDYDEYQMHTDFAEEQTMHAEMTNLHWERQVFTGKAMTNGRLTRVARTDMEREESRHAVYCGETELPELRAGGKFSVTGPGPTPPPDMVDRFFVTSIVHEYDIVHGYRNRITAVKCEASFEYRPPRTAAKPTATGPHAAIVVAPAPGEDFPSSVRVRFPWVKEDGRDCCVVRLAEMLAGNGYGTWFPPDVDQEVIVEFLNGDPDRPIVTGRLYNGRNEPGEDSPKVLAIRSKAGNEVRLNDSQGAEQVRLTAAKDFDIIVGAGGTLTVTDQSGNEVRIASSGIEVTSPAKVKVSASQVEISAGMVTINAGMSRFSGVVQCDTLITNAVISASYTPGAGNIW